MSQELIFNFFSFSTKTKPEDAGPKRGEVQAEEVLTFTDSESEDEEVRSAKLRVAPGGGVVKVNMTNFTKNQNLYEVLLLYLKSLIEPRANL